MATKKPSEASKCPSHLLSQAIPLTIGVSVKVWSGNLPDIEAACYPSPGFLLLFPDRCQLDCPSSSKFSLKPCTSELHHLIAADDLQPESST